MELPDVTAVVLCGGTSRRFGGSDKTAAAFRGATVLDHVLSELPADLPIVCVGEQRPTARPVSWTREDPPLSGPVAGIDAALELVGTPLVAVIAGDMPYAARALPDLLAALRGSPASSSAVAVASDGRLQPLLALHRTADLRAALPASPGGVPVRRVLEPLVVIPVSVDDRVADDIDTRADLERLDE